VQQTIFKYYFVGSARIALRENGTISWLLSDHLGSTSSTVSAAGALVGTLKYTSFLLRYARSASQGKQEELEAAPPTIATQASAIT